MKNMVNYYGIEILDNVEELLEYRMNKGFRIQDSDNLFIKPSNRESYNFKYSDNIIKPMTIEPNLPDIPNEPTIPDIRVETNLPNEPIEAIIPLDPIIPILNDIHIEGIIQNEHINVIKPTKPNDHSNDAEWDRYDSEMIRYRASKKLNKRPNCNNNYRFENLGNDVIIDDNKDIGFLTSENANLQWLRTWPESSIIWPPTNRNGCVKKKEELVNMFEPRPTSIWRNETNEPKLVEWLKTQHGSFIITQTGIDIEYLEACQIYCEKDDARQIQLNSNKNETKILVSNILGSKPDEMRGIGKV